MILKFKRFLWWSLKHLWNISIHLEIFFQIFLNGRKIEELFVEKENRFSIFVTFQVKILRMHTLSARRITEIESASESVWSCSCRKDYDVCKKEYKSKEDLISHMMTVQNNGEINCSKSSSFLFTRSLFLQKAFACLKI